MRDHCLLSGVEVGLSTFPMPEIQILAIQYDTIMHVLTETLQIVQTASFCYKHCRTKSSILF